MSEKADMGKDLKLMEYPIGKLPKSPKSTFQLALGEKKGPRIPCKQPLIQEAGRGVKKQEVGSKTHLLGS